MVSMKEAVAVAPAEPAPARPRRRRGVAGVRVPWIFALPGLVAYTFVMMVPNVQGILYSFTSWDGLSRHVHFVGLRNYVEVFKDDNFRSGLRHTLVLTATVVVVQILVGLALALALNLDLRSRNLLRTVFFLPVTLTAVAVGYAWKFLYAPEGVLNHLLQLAGLGSWQQDWLADPSINLFAIAVICIWQSMGLTMVVFLAGLQGIDPSLLEAAQLDGASAWQRFWHVTRPLLAPAFLINSVLCIVGGLKIFDQILVTTQGGPARSTSTLALMTYTDGIAAGNFSYGVTLSVVLALMTGVATAIQFKTSRSARTS